MNLKIGSNKTYLNFVNNCSQILFICKLIIVIILFYSNILACKEERVTLSDITSGKIYWSHCTLSKAFWHMIIPLHWSINLKLKPVLFTRCKFVGNSSETQIHSNSSKEHLQSCCIIHNSIAVLQQFPVTIPRKFMTTVQMIITKKNVFVNLYSNSCNMIITKKNVKQNKIESLHFHTWYIRHIIP